MTERRRVLVTGAGGFLGTALLRSLRREPSLDVFGILSPRQAEHENERTFVADVRDARSIKTIFETVRAHTAIHAAGKAHFAPDESLDELFEVNVRGTENVVQSAIEGGVGHIVHLSSVMVYGASQGLIDEATVPHALGPYGQSKLRAEQVAVGHAETGGVRMTILRLAMVPAVKNYSSLSDLARALSAGRFRWVGDGGNRKSVLVLSDFLSAIQVILADEHQSAKRETFNLSTGSVTMAELVEILAEGLEVKVPSFRIPRALTSVCVRLAGGRFGLPTVERLDKFLLDAAVSSDSFRSRFGWNADGDIRSTLLDYARGYRGALRRHS